MRGSYQHASLLRQLPTMDQSLAAYIRNVPDFPQPGIQFKDITTLLKEPDALRRATDGLVALVRGMAVDKVVGIESRGFIFGPLLADRLSAGFVPARKAGRLPGATVEASYALEYGTAQLALHQDAIEAGERVLIHDDLLATGGTARAASRLVEQLGGEVVQICFLMELNFLNGRRQLADYPVRSLIGYDQ